MKKVKLPVLNSNLTAIKAMGVLTSHRARAAIVESGNEYRLLELDDIGHAMRSNPDSQLDDVKHLVIDGRHIVGGHGSVDVTLVPPVAHSLDLRAPLYVCLPDRDFSSTSSTAICPTHNRRVQKQP
jgi:hypothetical protein